MSIEDASRCVEGSIELYIELYIEDVEARAQSPTSSNDCATKSASGGYRGVEPAVAVTCGSTTPRRLCL